MQVRFPGAARISLFCFCGLLETIFCVDCFTEFVKTPCAIACINICHFIKNSKILVPIPLFGHKTVLHALLQMGITAPAAAVTLGDLNQFRLKY